MDPNGLEALQIADEVQAVNDLAPNNADVQVNLNGKRLGYLDWDEFFMSTALLAAQRSKDPSTQVGAVIVDDETNVILGIGYNGFPRGCHDDDFPWGKDDENPLMNKYHYVCHAEMNAVLNRNHAQSRGGSIYTTLFPCSSCAKTIIQANIRTVVYLHDKPDKIDMKASRIMFEKAGIAMRVFQPKRDEVVLKFE